MPFDSKTYRREYQRKWRKLHPERNRELDKRNKEKRREKNKILHKWWFLRKMHNMSKEDFEYLFQNQNGKCAICNSNLSSKICVDHNHKTGKVRGLLCNTCNMSLGGFEDNEDLLKKAIKYLKESD